MPNQNDPSQNPNSAGLPVSQPASQAATPPVPPIIFPQSDLPPLSPEFQNLPETNAAAGPTDKPSTQSVIDNAGSSAPPDISSVTPKAKKKFGGGKIIATILGLVVLVGGVAAGIVLTQQRQLFKQRAAGEACSSDPRTAAVCQGKSVGDVAESCWSGYGNEDPSDDTSLVCRNSGNIGNDGKPLCAAIEESTPGSCSGGGGGGGGLPPNGASCHHTDGSQATIGGCVIYWCPNGCGGDGKCDEGDSGVYITHSGTCAEANTDLNGYCGQIDAVDENGMYCIPYDYDDSKIQCSNCTNPPPRTPPPTPTPTRTPTPTPTRTPTPTPVLSCGSECIQGSNSCPSPLTCEYLSAPNIFVCQNPTCTFNSGKDSNHDCICSTPTPTRTPTPTPTPRPPAPYCVAVTTYSSSWALIPESGRSSLTAGTTINFCVSGYGANGIFDKARFTITRNGSTGTPVETTTKRPGSSDYCKSYTILTGTTSISVKGEIHDSIYGWFGGISVN